MERNELLHIIQESRIGSDEVREVYRRMERDEVLSKYKLPQSPCKSDGCYHVHVADATKKSGRKDVKAKTIEELKEKLYKHECGISGTKRKTFREVFEIVEEQKLTYI